MAKPFNIVFGNNGSGSVTGVVFSLSNTGVSVTVDGKTQTVNLTVCGADRSTNDASGSTTLGYTASFNVSGLAEDVDINWSATQGSDTISGSFHTTGQFGTKGTLFFTTCFNSHPNGLSVNAWSCIEAYIDQKDSPVLSVIHLDDIYYSDGGLATTQSGAQSAQGKTIQYPNNNGVYKTQYDYAAWYFTWGQVLDGWKNPDNSETLNGAYLTDSMSNVLSKTCFMPQWGDHEFVNNLHNVDKTIVPNQFHKTTNGFDGNALVVYNQLMKPLQGTSIATADTQSNHWAATFGPVKVITADAMTRPATDRYGDNQVLDLLNEANDPTVPFKIICTPVSGNERVYQEGFLSSAQYKTEVTDYPEFQRMFVDSGQTPTALCDNPLCNGGVGNFLTMRGDWHTGCVYEYTATVNGIPENFVEVSLATMSASAPGTAMAYSQSDIATMSANGMAVVGGLYRTDVIAEAQPIIVSCTSVEFDGTKGTPEMVVKRWDLEKSADGYVDNSYAFRDGYPAETMTDKFGNIWRVSFARKWVQGDSNLGMDVDATPSRTLPSVTGGQSNNSAGI